MTTRAEIVREARRWGGTPYEHQGRSRHGLDCSGLVLLVGARLGLLDPAKVDRRDYSRSPDGWSFKRDLDAHLVWRGETLDDLATGCIGHFWINRRKYPQHVGILYWGQRGELRIVHAEEGLGEVKDEGLTPRWQMRLCGVYDYPGVRD